MPHFPLSLQVYSISLGGTITETSFAMSGSGSTYINGFADKYWREGMTEQEAMDFVTKALRWVGGMGGVIQVGTGGSYAGAPDGGADGCLGCCSLCATP